MLETTNVVYLLKTANVVYFGVNRKFSHALLVVNDIKRFIFMSSVEKKVFPIALVVFEIHSRTVILRSDSESSEEQSMGTNGHVLDPP